MLKRGLFFSFIAAVVLLTVSAVSAQMDPPVVIRLARTNDSITLIIGGNGTVNIENLTFEVEVTAGQGATSQPDRESYRLDAFAGFMGIPFNRMPAPSCFHIEVSGVRAVIDDDCLPATLFRQILAPSDRFWVNRLGNPAPINILNGETLMGSCGASESLCEILYFPEMELGAACENLLNLPMVVVPASEFLMGMGFTSGEANERPQRRVKVDAFCIDVTEVNIGLYAYCVASGACTPPRATDAANFATYYPNMEAYPVVNVTHQQAQQLCEFRGGRLPTEAEWELVARYDPDSDTMRTYPFGDQVPTSRQANFNSDRLRPAGESVIDGNPYGVADLSGNAAEWVLDGYGLYNPADLDNPRATTNQSEFVVRGGSYANDAAGIRGAARVSQGGESSTPMIGFRCVIPIGGA